MEVACELDPAAAFALNSNAKPQHIFWNASELRPDGQSFCYVHGNKCKIPNIEFDLYCGGFSCKSNSRQNPSRSAVDPCETKHWDSFLHCHQFVHRFRPACVLLENVCGIKLPRQAGKESVLSVVMEKLQTIEGYTWAHFELDSACLPDVRPRVYFLAADWGRGLSLALNPTFRS